MIKRIQKACGMKRWIEWYLPRCEKVAKEAAIKRVANWKYMGPFNAIETATKGQAYDKAFEAELYKIASEIQA